MLIIDNTIKFIEFNFEKCSPQCTRHNYVYLYLTEFQSKNPFRFNLSIRESYYFFFVIECNLRARVINAKYNGIEIRANREFYIGFAAVRYCTRFNIRHKVWIMTSVSDSCESLSRFINSSLHIFLLDNNSQSIVTIN